VNEGDISGGGEEMVLNTKEMMVIVTEGRESEKQEQEGVIER
jgi:hypothetical protein